MAYVGDLDVAEAKRTIIREGFGWIQDEVTVSQFKPLDEKGFKVPKHVYLGVWRAVVEPSFTRDICRSLFDAPLLTIVTFRTAVNGQIHRPSSFFAETCKNQLDRPGTLGIQVWPRETVVFVHREQALPQLAKVYMPEGGVSFTWMPAVVSPPDKVTAVGLECVKGLGVYGSFTSQLNYAKCIDAVLHLKGEEFTRMQEMLRSLQERGLQTNVKILEDQN